MKYTLTRKYNIKARLPDNPQYEMVEFSVLEAETPKQATEELEFWAREFFQDLKNKFFEQARKEAPAGSRAKESEDNFFEGLK